MILTSNTWENERLKEMDRERKKKTKCNNGRCDSFVNMRLFLFHDLNKQIGVYIFELKFIGVKRKSKSKFKRKPYFFFVSVHFMIFYFNGPKKKRIYMQRKRKKETHTQHTPAKFNKKIKHSEIAYVTEAIRLLRQVYSMLGLCIYTNNTRQKLVHYTRQMNKKKIIVHTNWKTTTKSQIKIILNETVINSYLLHATFHMTAALDWMCTRWFVCSVRRSRPIGRSVGRLVGRLVAYLTVLVYIKKIYHAVPNRENDWNFHWNLTL